MSSIDTMQLLIQHYYVYVCTVPILTMQLMILCDVPYKAKQ